MRATPLVIALSLVTSAATLGSDAGATGEIRALEAGAPATRTLPGGVEGKPVVSVDEARRHASPLNHVSASTKPILVIHSDDDKSVPVQQAADFVEKLKAAGVRHRYVHFTDRGHMGITDEVIKEARAFIAEVEQKKP